MDVSERLLKSPASAQWKKIGIKHHHGINVPLFSLRTKNSCGIGEFLDMVPLIDWCSGIGLDVIQTLPLNDSGNDPSPYNALSATALNPLYLSLHALPFLEEFPALKEKLPALQKLSESQRINYQEVKNQKMSWLREYFDKASPKLLQNKDYTDFVSSHPYLEAYALFKVIKDLQGQNHWTTWPQLNYEETRKEHQNAMSFYLALQFLCFEQFKKIKEHAAAKGVFIKGDIPILISSDSADVWKHRHLFDLALAAGAPPDPYNQEGQYWGFPIYRWDVLKKEQYYWWKERLTAASALYDLYRLDHVVGFFRIWAIPIGKHSSEGGFIPQDFNQWIPQGKEILEMMLSSSLMLPIAEDLGTVPPEARVCLTELGICGTKVMRWERKWREDSRFIPFQEYPPESMTCISTHDSQTLAQWWKENSDEAKTFAAFKNWNYAPDLTREQRKELLWDSHHTGSLFHINLLQEYLALFPELSWPKPEDERINIPGKLLPFNWTYRIRPYLEELTSHEDLKKEMKAIISPSSQVNQKIA